MALCWPDFPKNCLLKFFPDLTSRAVINKNTIKKKRGLVHQEVVNGEKGVNDPK